MSGQFIQSMQPPQQEIQQQSMQPPQQEIQQQQFVPPQQPNYQNYPQQYYPQDPGVDPDSSNMKLLANALLLFAVAFCLFGLLQGEYIIISTSTWLFVTYIYFNMLREFKKADPYNFHFLNNKWVYIYIFSCCAICSLSKTGPKCSPKASKRRPSD